MTMKRSEKAGHQEILDTAKNSKIGKPAGQFFSSPKEIVQRGGRKQMTIKEYIERRMGRSRGRLSEEIHREGWAEKRRGRRKITRK